MVYLHIMFTEIYEKKTKNNLFWGPEGSMFQVAAYFLEASIRRFEVVCWNRFERFRKSVMLVCRLGRINELRTCGCFLNWWYPQNTPKWSFLAGKPMVVGGAQQPWVYLLFSSIFHVCFHLMRGSPGLWTVNESIIHSFSGPNKEMYDLPRNLMAIYWSVALPGWSQLFYLENVCK